MFKYLGLLITSDLSWSKHIHWRSMHQGKENLGPIVPSILLACWPGYSSPTILYPLYGPTWSMQLQSGTHTWEKQDLFESTQKCACKMTIRKWGKGYDELLNMTNLPSLADRRLYLKLCSLYKIVHNLSYFPPNIIVPKVTRSYIALLLPCTSPLHILIVFFFF